MVKGKSDSGKHHGSHRTSSLQGLISLPYTSPPPAKAFWLSQPFPVHGRGTGDVYVRLELEPPRSRYGIKSPVNDAVLYPELMVGEASDEERQSGLIADIGHASRVHRLRRYV